MTEVLVEKRGAVQWITINREDRRNAMNDAVIDAIMAGLAAASADPEIRAVVLTGAGDRAFCAGADLSAGSGSFKYDYSKVGIPFVKADEAGSRSDGAADCPGQWSCDGRRHGHDGHVRHGDRRRQRSLRHAGS